MLDPNIDLGNPHVWERRSRMSRTSKKPDAAVPDERLDVKAAVRRHSIEQDVKDFLEAGGRVKEIPSSIAQPANWAGRDYDRWND